MSTMNHPASSFPVLQPQTSDASPASVHPAYVPLNWSFPFAPLGQADASDPMTYMKALGCAEDGFYPLGANGNWHGGIHFDEKTAAVLQQGDGVRAIADGEVVAYRLDEKYPELAYKDGKLAHYSTSFVLIRHRLRLPPDPGQRQVEAKPGETLIFFSLYMHLLDLKGYRDAMRTAASKTPTREMRYWLGNRSFRVGDGAKDQQSKSRQKPHHVQANPAQACDFGDLVEPVAVSSCAGAPRAVLATPSVEPVALFGIKVHGSKKGRPIGLLPRGCELKVVGEARSGWAQIASLKKGQPVGLMAGSTASINVASGWVELDHLEFVMEPESLGEVVVLKEPVAVKAGEVVGHVGHYMRYNDASALPPQRSRTQLHVEVFAGADLPDFVDRSRERARNLPDTKTLFEISPGAVLVSGIPAPDRTLMQTGLKLVPLTRAKGTRWLKVQPKTLTMPPAQPHAHHHRTKPKPIEENLGPPLWVERGLVDQITTAPVSGWSEFPLTLANASGPAADFRDVCRRVDLDELGEQKIAREDGDTGAYWWNVGVGAKDGRERQGWVREKDHPNMRWCSAWDWPGFEFADGDKLTPVHMFTRFLFVAGLLLVGENKSEFEPAASLVNSSELITKLEQAIDTNRDGTVTAQELRHAQQTTWMAQALSHLVVRCESEWGGDMSKWKAMMPLMKKLDWMWERELERIERLQWWKSEVEKIEGFPQGLNPWHFHPVGVVGNFIGKRRKRHDDNLGALSSHFETGGRGPGTISGGLGDPGGVSYGSYQFTSQTRQSDGGVVVGGTVRAFVTSPHFPWAGEFVGLIPGSTEFSRKWRKVVDENLNDFHKIEHEYTRRTHYDAQIQFVLSQNGIDLRYHSHTLNDVVWSTCVQHGPTTDAIVIAMKRLGDAPSETKDYDRKLIDAIYDERGKKNNAGKLIRFIHASQDQQDGVSRRYVAERPKALLQLEDEMGY
ncbi:lytic transglycosylase domain-containing protein [Paraburkholderia sp. D15]|uniref:VgrG-related protein n=1 Tax=Paraburkholderia sp. D15 TaxID=2880218 RepID=UPI00247A4100|nr:lytic transglycosylase domain-containing protein [Paraburkholderia sp. D15]WGS54703.1 lytic transglycosylase domain-containing protein [Paraburkholderia sp. D15]